MIEPRLVRDLLTHLEVSRDLFAELQDRLVDERDALVRLDSSAIARITADKEKLAYRHASLERERRRLLSEAGIPDAPISELYGLVPLANAPKARRLGQELKTLVIAVREMNALNRRLVQNSLAALARSVQALSGDRDRPPRTYAHLNPMRAQRRGYAAAGREL